MFKLLALVSIALAQFDYDFKVGQKYDYLFNSSSGVKFARTLSDEGKTQGTSIAAVASIYCKNVADSGYTFELSLSKVHITQHDFEGKVVYDDSSDSLQQRFAKYFRFSLQKDGSVHEVVAAANEDDSVLSIKSGIIGQFILKDETADNQGFYSSAFKRVETDDSIELSRSYTEKNFISFHNAKVNSEKIGIESSETKVIQNKLPFTIGATSRVYFSGKETDASYTGSSISSNAVITMKLMGFEKGSSHYYNGKLKAVTFFEREWYLSRVTVDNIPKKSSKRDIVKDTTCPNSSLDLCEGYTNKWVWGDDDFNAYAGVSVLAGVNDQCPAPTRNFVASASAQIGITLLGYDLPIGNLSAGYGYVNGKAQQNGVSFVLFDKVPLFNWTIPDVLCQSGSYDLGTYEIPIPDYNYTYYILGEIPVTFEIAVNATFNAVVNYGFCDKNTSASVGIVPSLTVSPNAQVSTDLVVARAGITLAVEDVNDVTPTLSVDGAKCALDLWADLDITVDVSFKGWFQYWDFIDWSDVYTFTIFEDTIVEADFELFNFEWTLGSKNE